MSKLAPGIAVLLAAGCAAGRVPSAPYPLRRLGPERGLLRYDEPHAAAKRALFERINRDRERHGVARLAYEPRAALAGDQFCLDAALAGTTGHWDAAGRGPYLRWALAGGVDYHVQNVVAYSFGSGAVRRPVEELLLEGHEGMMAERPPRDGHRRAILDPLATHVGIGLATAAGEFRMTQEFTRVGLEWIELPEGPRPAGSLAHVAGRPLPGLWLGRVEILHEPPPRPPALLEAPPRGGGYAYPPPAHVLRPLLGSGYAYADRSRGEFRVRRDRGPGHYFVVCHVGRRLVRDEPLWPVTAALVAAVA
jgi:uncharacterized protein YkwD